MTHIAAAKARAAVLASASGLRTTVALSLCILLAGCGANMAGALQTFRSAAQAPAPLTTPPPSGLPAVWLQRGPLGGWLVQGDTPLSADSAGSAPTVTHWFSADGAVLRLDGGRLVGFTETALQWTTVSPLPRVDWHAVAAGAALPHARVVDVQPGYRLGQRWSGQLMLSLSGGPEGRQLTLQLPRSARWFVEQRPDRDGTGHPQPRFWYAVDLAQRPASLLYGRACLLANECLEWLPAPGVLLR